MVIPSPLELQKLLVCFDITPDVHYASGDDYTATVLFT